MCFCEVENVEIIFYLCFEKHLSVMNMTAMLWLVMEAVRIELQMLMERSDTAKDV